MEFKNDQKVESTIRFVYYFISAILCLFLILLTDKILDDLGSSLTRPTQQALENKNLQDSLSGIKKPLSLQMEEYTSRSEQLQKTAAKFLEKIKALKSQVSSRCQLDCSVLPWLFGIILSHCFYLILLFVLFWQRVIRFCDHRQFPI